MNLRWMMTLATILFVMGYLLSSWPLTSAENVESVFAYANEPTTNSVSGQVEEYSYDNNDAALLTTTAVETTIIEKTALSGTIQTDDVSEYWVSEPPTPKKNKPKYQYVETDELDFSKKESTTRAIQNTITAGGTETNINNTGGFLFIPADAHGAAGPNHVVSVINVSIEFYDKDGTQDFSDDLQAFFSALTPANFTFDPKVIYDQYEDRWLVVTLERVDSGTGAASDASLVLLAVSDDSDPNGSWTVTEINTKINIGGLPHWLDYPGLAVDDQAIYITGNMFRFLDGSPTAGNSGGNRLIIVDKSFYNGGSASASIFDQTTISGGFAVTQMPAHVYGNPGGSVGTWLVGYSGITNGFQESIQLIRVNNPLSANPTFTRQLVSIGNVDNTGGGDIPDAPQAGTSTDIDSGDRRVLDAVWRNDSIYFTTEVLPGSGTDAGEATAFWGQIETNGTPSFVQGNTIGGNTDIANNTYTSYASIAVNEDEGVTVGFTASNNNIFPSSYFVHRSPSDPLDFMRPAQLIRAGEESYVRTFGGGTNRWGDYSATAVDPDEECFWIYNKYATEQGNTTTGGEDGQYLTAFAHFCNDNPVAMDDSLSGEQGDTITEVDGGSSLLTANDTDVDFPDDTLTVVTTPVSGPTNGSLTLNSDGSFSYSHNNSLATSDQFVYRVCDDGSPVKCDDGTVNITIEITNSPPIANDDSIDVDEGGTTTTVTAGANSLLFNDTDPNDINLIVSLDTDVINGDLTLNTNGTFSYTHDGSETTADSFIYELCDDQMACDTATASITVFPVNDPPNANDDAVTTLNGGTVSILDIGSDSVLANDSDPDDNSLTAQVVVDVMHGMLILNADGTFSYAHDGSANTTDSFSYEACDDENPINACSTAVVSIMISTTTDLIFADDFE